MSADAASDGLDAIVGAMPNAYLRAEDAASSLWPARIHPGGTLTVQNAPTYSATGYGGVSPAVVFTEGSGQSVDMDALATAQNADNNTANLMLFATDLARPPSGSRYLFGYGSDGTHHPRLSLTTDAAGTISMYNSNNAGTGLDAIVSVPTISASRSRTIIAMRYQGNANLRTVVIQGGIETVFHDNVSTANLSGISFPNFELHHLPWGSSDIYSPDSKLAAWAMWQGAAAQISDSQLSDLAARGDALWPTS